MAQSSAERSLQVKLVLLGGTTVGKSSIAQRFVNNMFEAHREPTIGAAFFAPKCRLGDLVLKFEIWDTSGQERFHSLALMYYRNAQATVVVYDITKASSFQRAKSWVQELQRQADPNIVIALAGTKVDLVQTSTWSTDVIASSEEDGTSTTPGENPSPEGEPEPSRQVPREEALAYATEAGLLFFETSAKTGENIIELFAEIAKKIPIGEMLSKTDSNHSEAAGQDNIVNLNTVNPDIKKYLVDHFYRIASKWDLDPTWPGQEIINGIASNSSVNVKVASVVIKIFSDEDNNDEDQHINQDLEPHERTALFTVLDQLYLEILKRQPEQDFLKAFLALLVGRTTVSGYTELYKDDAMLLGISLEELSSKLRMMRSVLKFQPHVDVRHQSFLDFLKEHPRSGPYHVNEQDAIRQYAEMIVNSIIQSILTMIENPDSHEHSTPAYSILLDRTSIAIQLPVQVWEEILQPLERTYYELRGKSKRGYCDQCHVLQVADNLLSHLNFLRVSGQPNFNMNFGRLFFGPAAVLGLVLTALTRSSYTKQ